MRECLGGVEGVVCPLSTPVWADLGGRWYEGNQHWNEI